MRKWLVFILTVLLLFSACGEEKPVWTDPVPPNEYDAEAFGEGNGFLCYHAGPSYVGVDVSNHQESVDWTLVAEAGVEFAIIRAGYRGYTEGVLHEDPCFRANMEGALAAGLDVGVYFFSQAVSEEEAVEEAEFLLTLVEGYELTYPLVFDWERQEKEDSRTKDTDGETQTLCAIAFCRRIEEAGHLPMVYFSPSKAYGEMDLERLMEWPFWLAHYTPERAPTSFCYHFHMWQYDNHGQVPGIEGDVDLNLCLTDFSRWHTGNNPMG